MEKTIHIPVIDPRPNATGYIITPGFKEGLLYQQTVMPAYGLVNQRNDWKMLRYEHKLMQAIGEEINQAEAGGNTEKLETLQQRYESKKDLVEYITDDLGRKYTWIIAYNLPKGDRRKKIVPKVESGDLEEVIDQAAAIFSKHAKIRTLDSPIFSHDLKFSDNEMEWCATYGHPMPRSVPRYREFPVPEGVLQYFRKEYRKRRQKLIRGID